jgi:peptidoglycan hydrolase CwlO-like protein
MKIITNNILQYYRMPKKGEIKQPKQPKEPKEVKEDNQPKRADYKLRNYTEDNVNDDIAKIQKQIKKLELSINEHDKELDKKNSDHKELKKQLQEMEAIKQLLANVEI